MSMTGQNVGCIMNIGKESETVEFKKSTSEAKEGIISISSILNKHGSGSLYFGVKDNGDVIGQEIGKDTERKLSRDISDNLNPPIWYEIKTCHTDDGKSFLEVFFQGTSSPYSAYGRYYQRFADEDRQIFDTELEKLFKTRQKDYSEWENGDSYESVSDIDEERLKKVVRDGNDSGRIQYEFTDSRSILSKLRMLNASNGNLINAGKVLFSRNHPVLLKTAVYATETKDTFIKLNHFEGNIFECIDDGIAFIMSSIHWNVVISGNAKRNEQPEIPAKAVREMTVNAFAHGFYGANTAFTIEVFSDRVVIYSPGLFPPGFKPEDFAENAAEPIMLNPKIVNVLFKSGVIESFGSGYERTFSACRDAGVEYEYENTRTGFKFVFLRPHGHNNVHVMSGSEKVVYTLLSEYDFLTNAELASRIGKSEKTVYRAIKALKENGYLERHGTDNNGYWKILK